MHFRLVTLTAICGLALTTQAEVRLARVITDHAVLQRDAPIHIWGEGNPGETIAIAFHAQSLTTRANSLGLWEVWLAPEAAGGPYTLSLRGSSTLQRSDLLVGDVWFASGQSNMEMPLGGFPGNAVVKNADQEITHADLPEVRLLRMERASSDAPLSSITAVWRGCTPATAKDFSAVAYFFGRDIHRHEHVPIGLIDSSWGGTPIDSWISLEGLSADASFMRSFANRADFAGRQAHVAALEAAEKREDAEAAEKHLPPLPIPGAPTRFRGSRLVFTTPWLRPSPPTTIRGFLWYQGESDSSPERVDLYAKMLPALILDWRRQWRQGDLPFLYVQISSVDSPGENWGLLRDSQRRALYVANTGMAVSLDVGQRDNVHPPDKQTVGERLALAGRALAYGEPDLAYRGPLYRQTTREGNAVRVWFDHAEGLHSSAGEIKGFEIAGADGHFEPATASIHDETVLVTSPAVEEPVQIRYAWANFTDANLYNAVSLPASTFQAMVP